MFQLEQQALARHEDDLRHLHHAQLTGQAFEPVERLELTRRVVAWWAYFHTSGPANPNLERPYLHS
ncbi:MAG: hypothetical protein HY875_04540 [Chloroflexi bacterium]|nr:hypothetical protein [Chloroflexota bacterium]